MFYLIIILRIVASCCFAQQQIDQLALGEACFVNNDLFEAEKVFKNIIKTSSNNDTFFKSMSRLVDIAKMNGDKKLFRDILDNFKNVQNVSSESYSSLLYNIGKYSFHDGNCDLGLKFIDKIAASSPYYWKGLYIKASCLALDKKFKEALLLFDKITKSKGVYSSKDVRDLSMMGKARIFSVLGRFKDAIISYQSLDAFSPYYLMSLYETGMLFISSKDYDNALYHLEALSLLDQGTNGSSSLDDIYGQGITEFSFMKIKTMRGYIYMEQKRFEEANIMFDEVSKKYNKIKKVFSDELNKFKLSDDLRVVVSHPFSDGYPRNVEANIDYALFDNEQPYAKAFRDWLNVKEKTDLKRTFSTYFSLDRRVESLIASKANSTLSDEELRLVAIRNLMNRYIKRYIGMLVKVINGRLDDVGLKAQLGKIDITWKIKEDQSKKIKDIQENKQRIIEDLDFKYKGYTE